MAWPEGEGSARQKAESGANQESSVQGGTEGGPELAREQRGRVACNPWMRAPYPPDFKNIKWHRGKVTVPFSPLG